MTFIWQFNVILKKLLEYKVIGTGFPLIEFQKYIRDLPVLGGCEPDMILKLGKSINFLNQEEDESIVLCGDAELFLDKMNERDITKLTLEQKKLVTSFLLDNWIFNDLVNFVIKRQEQFLIYKGHRSKYCGILISMMKNLSLIKDTEDDLFFRLNREHNDYWNENLRLNILIEEFPNELIDLREFWDKFFTDQEFTEEDLERILKIQKKIGETGEEIAFEIEKNIVSTYSNPDLLKEVKLISKDYVNKGYDLLSVCPDGRRKYIEVKSTIGKKMRFFFSRNEYAKSIEYKSDYWIYFVYFNEKSCKMFNNIKELIDSGVLILEPNLYEVNIPFEKIPHENFDFSEISYEL